MSDNNHLKPLNIALGAAFASALSVGVATAAENPFGQSELAGGYMVAGDAADKAKMEGKCGEGKCGAANKMPKEGQCGTQNKMQKEGKCGEGLCGAMGKAQKEGDKAATPDSAVKPE
jgi:uncharacterized low-complexity protein